MIKKFRLTIDLSIESTLREPEEAQREISQSLGELEAYLSDSLYTFAPGFSLAVEETKSEPLYTAGQPIWFHKKLPAVFLEYIGMAVQIRTYGSMCPQTVDLSTISPREETPQ